jgi:hypothetical protein
MPDRRTPLQKRLDEIIGPPLYYCSDCLCAVKVVAREGQEPVITRACGEDCGHQIIAPRKAIAHGEGGLSLPDRIKVKASQIGSALTGRSV